MASITTDGKEYVYAVFGADGCECDSLEAVFATEQLAKDYIAKVTAIASGGDYAYYGEEGLLEVRVIEVRTSIEGDNETVKTLKQKGMLGSSGG